MHTSSQTQATAQSNAMQPDTKLALTPLGQQILTAVRATADVAFAPSRPERR